MINVAIDGPAGAGKSTVAKAAAKELGYIYVDTGALYRTVALNAVRNSIIDDSEKIVDMLSSTQVELKYVDGVQAVYLNGEDVSSLIRTPEISMGASKVSAIPEVRAFLLDLQRDIAKNNHVIMDGRDIATVVLPDAQVKIFLFASPECRAMRRYKELIEKGQNVKYEDVMPMSISATIRTLTEKLLRLSRVSSLFWQTHRIALLTSQSHLLLKLLRRI